jgi:hypothetical protein
MVSIAPHRPVANVRREEFAACGTSVYQLLHEHAKSIRLTTRTHCIGHTLAHELQAASGQVVRSST